MLNGFCAHILMSNVINQSSLFIHVNDSINSGHVTALLREPELGIMLCHAVVLVS